MKRVASWLGMAAAAIMLFAALTATGIYLVSGEMLARTYQPRTEILAAPSPAQVADAARQARILGCVSCHGEGLTGKLMFQIPNVARVYAPNLTEVAARSSDQQLAAAIRQGIGHDGRALFVMPSPMYARMSDAEVAAMVGWIRTLPREKGRIETFSAGPLGRYAIVTGKLRPAPLKLDEFRDRQPVDTGPRHAAGRRLAANTCSECHGPALEGIVMEDGTPTPDLAIAGAYDADQFRTLMRTGIAPGGRRLGLMTEVAAKDFAHFSDDELDALHLYLRARAESSGR